MSERFDALRPMQCLVDVPDDVVRWLADHVRPQTFVEGDTLIVEGSADRDCYFIVRGETEVRAGGSVMGRSGPGEPEGEMAMFFRRPRGATTTALEPVETLLLEAAAFDTFASEHPAEAAALQTGILSHLARRFSN